MHLTTQYAWMLYVFAHIRPRSVDVPRTMLQRTGQHEAVDEQAEEPLPKFRRLRDV